MRALTRAVGWASGASVGTLASAACTTASVERRCSSLTSEAGERAKRKGVGETCRFRAQAVELRAPLAKRRATALLAALANGVPGGWRSTPVCAWRGVRLERGVDPPARAPRSRRRSSR
jgi:hypothetical protein